MSEKTENRDNGSMNLKDRTRWAINYISAKYRLSNPKIARRMGVKNDTVNSYRAKLSNPKVDFIVKFCDEFDIDLIWFTKGEGEPFPGAVEKYPEVCSQTSYEIARHENRGTASIEKVSAARGPAPETAKGALENPTEKSFRRLCELVGISIERGWKKNLSNFLGIPPGHISNSILRGKISKNILKKIDEKGVARERWIVSGEPHGAAIPQSQASAVDVELSFQKLAIIAGIRIGQNWLFDLASLVDLEPMEIRRAIRHDRIDEETMQAIENRGFGRELWTVERQVVPDALRSQRQPMKTNDLMEMTAYVLASDTLYATTLALNIEAFYKAVTAENIRSKRPTDR